MDRHTHKNASILQGSFHINIQTLSRWPSKSKSHENNWFDLLYNRLHQCIRTELYAKIIEVWHVKQKIVRVYSVVGQQLDIFAWRWLRKARKSKAVTKYCVDRRQSANLQHNHLSKATYRVINHRIPGDLSCPLTTESQGTVVFYTCKGLTYDICDLLCHYDEQREI